MRRFINRVLHQMLLACSNRGERITWDMGRKVGTWEIWYKLGTWEMDTQFSTGTLKGRESGDVA
jgi:hypothetical protein